MSKEKSKGELKNLKSTPRRKKLKPFYSKFRAELKEFIPGLQRHYVAPLKILKPSCS